MGDQLMKRVLREWGDLPGNSYKVLMVMASCAMDDAEPAIYFGGWERLALLGLGRRDWPADDDDSPTAQAFRKSSEELVRRAVRDLLNRGAIEQHRRGRLGVRAEYRLTLPQQIVVSLPQQKVAEGQRIVAEGQQKVGANYQHSQHPQTGEPTSPLAVTSPGVAVPVDKARLTDEQRANARRRVDGEAVA